MTEYCAPCVGGPWSGEQLPYEYRGPLQPPGPVLVRDGSRGKYVFVHSSGAGAHPFHGDTWVWHPFLASLSGPPRVGSRG
jgi:hypothetical protein